NARRARRALESDQRVRAEVRDLVVDALARAAAERGHRDHRGDADGDLEDGEPGAERIASHRAKRDRRCGQHAPEPGRHSCLSAATGRSCDPRLAGKTPNRMPIAALVPTATTTAEIGGSMAQPSVRAKA